MLDYLEYSDHLYGKTILESSCGNGQFLKEIVIRYIKDSQSRGLSRTKIKNGLGRDIFEIEQNKALFDFLFSRKSSIEETMGTQLIWSRMDDNKASKIHISLPGVDISKDTDWPRMTKFHVDASKGLYRAFKEPLEQYFNISL